MDTVAYLELVSNTIDDLVKRRVSGPEADEIVVELQSVQKRVFTIRRDAKEEV
jgi:hypothetical protein